MVTLSRLGSRYWLTFIAAMGAVLAELAWTLALTAWQCFVFLARGGRRS